MRASSVFGSARNSLIILSANSFVRRLMSSGLVIAWVLLPITNHQSQITNARDPDLRDKVSARPGPARTPVVGRYRCSRAENLPTQDAGLFRFWQGAKQVDNPQRKLFSSPPQVFRTGNCLGIIANHKSPITNRQCRQFLSGFPFLSMYWMRSLVFFWPQRLRKASRSKSSRYCSETSCGEVNSPPPERIFAN